MTKRIIGAIVVIFIAVEAVDFLINGVLLKEAYAATASLWRPEAEMKMGLMFVVTLIFIVSFVLIYALFFKEKTVKNGFLYGLIFGIGTGVSMGYGSYCFMPLPYYLALSWFLGSVVELTLAGLILGFIVKD